MSRNPAITSLLNGQAVNSGVCLDQCDIQSPIGATEKSSGGRAAEATAHHDDARRCCACGAYEEVCDKAAVPGLALPREGQGGDFARTASFLRRASHVAIATPSSWREALGDPIHNSRRPRPGPECIERRPRCRSASRPVSTGGGASHVMTARATRRSRRWRCRTDSSEHGRQRHDACAPSCAAEIVQPQRQRADALAGRREDRVQHRWPADRDGRLADAAPEPSGGNDHRLHLRHLGRAASPDSCRNCFPPRGPCRS